MSYHEFPPTVHEIPSIASKNGWLLHIFQFLEIILLILEGKFQISAQCAWNSIKKRRVRKMIHFIFWEKKVKSQLMFAKCTNLKAENVKMCRDYFDHYLKIAFFHVLNHIKKALGFIKAELPVLANQGILHKRISVQISGLSVFCSPLISWLNSLMMFKILFSKSLTCRATRPKIILISFEMQYYRVQNNQSNLRYHEENHRGYC